MIKDVVERLIIFSNIDSVIRKRVYSNYVYEFSTAQIRSPVYAFEVFLLTPVIETNSGLRTDSGIDRLQMPEDLFYHNTYSDFFYLTSKGNAARDTASCSLIFNNAIKSEWINMRRWQVFNLVQNGKGKDNLYTKRDYPISDPNIYLYIAK